MPGLVLPRSTESNLALERLIRAKHRDDLRQAEAKPIEPEPVRWQPNRADRRAIARAQRRAR